ncbi:MAG TPA: transcription termination/antitermination protein NusG [Planctomycetota bacterium]|nr:transcription termination/antitermination protein NusG [Planctomycetota bacterium]
MSDVVPPEEGTSAASDPNLRWYVVRVQSGREESVKDGLLRRVNAAGLGTKITNVIVPTEKVTEIRSGRKTIREKKLYPGYIMIQMLQDKDAWFLVRETPGIGDFLGLKEPIPMAEHEVNKMLVEQTGAEEEKPRIKIDFQKGDTVRVKEGAFENFDGIVEEINSQKGLVGITITIFGRATRVELEYWQVEKV